MRSLLALIICTGLIAWAHAGKHKYFGLRARQQASFSATDGPSVQDNNMMVSTASVSNNVFHLPAIHSVYLRSLQMVGQDTLLRGRLLANGMSSIWLQQVQ